MSAAESTDERLARVLAAHFDPRWGSSFWLERARALGFDPRRELRGARDLPLLGSMPLEALALRPIEDFVPRRDHAGLASFVSSETGGTTGAPRRTVFSAREFEEAFVAPFLAAAAAVGFPRDRHWLFIGPSGPHAIGKAARACAVACGSVDPFSVDFDPRWARKLPPDSLARRRYTEHVLAQAEAILATQEIGVLFATPPVLRALGQRLPAARREAIAGVHLGGIAADDEFWKGLTAEWFPNAVALAGYGNSLAGVCPQLEPARGQAPEYFAHGTRLVLEVAAPSPAERGRVRFHRLDESGFLPNVLERDVALAIERPDLAARHGFAARGLRDPRPPVEAPEAQAGGLY